MKPLHLNIGLHRIIMVIILQLACAFDGYCGMENKISVNNKQPAAFSEKDFPASICPLSNEDISISINKNRGEFSFQRRIHKDLPEFKFAIMGKVERNDYFQPKYLKITKRNEKKPFQIIKNPLELLEWSLPNDRSGFICFDDLNFDGYLDLKVFNNAGATGNIWYVVFLYDPAKHRYIFNQRLSELSSIQALPSKKIVSSYFRCGAAIQFMGFYRARGSNVRLLHAAWEGAEFRSESYNYIRLIGRPKHYDTWIDQDSLCVNASEYLRKGLMVTKKENINDYLLEDRKYYDPRRGLHYTPEWMLDKNHLYLKR